jgi:hypothetical protein
MANESSSKIPSLPCCTQYRHILHPPSEHIISRYFYSSSISTGLLCMTVCSKTSSTLFCSLCHSTIRIFNLGLSYVSLPSLMLMVHSDALVLHPRNLNQIGLGMQQSGIRYGRTQFDGRMCQEYVVQHATLPISFFPMGSGFSPRSAFCWRSKLLRKTLTSRAPHSLTTRYVSFWPNA